MKAGVKPSNRIAGTFGLYRKPEGNGRVDLVLIGSPMGQTTERTNRKKRIGVLDIPEKGLFCWPNNKDKGRNVTILFENRAMNSQLC
jgi:hypothetical protein